MFGKIKKSFIKLPLRDKILPSFLRFLNRPFPSPFGLKGKGSFYSRENTISSWKMGWKLSFRNGEGNRMLECFLGHRSHT